MRKQAKRRALKPRPKDAAGRATKSKLTPQFIDDAVTLCSSLATDIAVCRALKIDPSTWCDWKNRAERGQQPHRRMFEAIQEARGLKTIALISKIASDPDWRAAAWLAERLDPDTYSQKSRHEHTGAKGAPLLAPAPAAITVVVQGGATDNPYDPSNPNKWPASSTNSEQPGQR